MRFVVNQVVTGVTQGFHSHNTNAATLKRFLFRGCSASKLLNVCSSDATLFKGILGRGRKWQLEGNKFNTASIFVWAFAL